MKKVLFVTVLMGAPTAISNLAQAQPNLSQVQRMCVQDCAANMGYVSVSMLSEPQGLSRRVPENQPCVPASMYFK